MTDSQYLDKALDFIVEIEKGNDRICEVLHKYPETNKMCMDDCQGICRICVLKFLETR